MAKDPHILAHQEWLGFVQPVGLVVSIPALHQAQAFVDKHIAPVQQRLLEIIKRDDEDRPYLERFQSLACNVLGWDPSDLHGAEGQPRIPNTLEVTLPEYNETLRPSFAVPLAKPKDADRPWLLLVQSVLRGADFDKVATESDQQWQASPQARFERLLRETQVPIGLLFNGTHIRLVYAPRGETSGYLTFPLDAMTQVAGRPILAALHMLLGVERLFTVEEKQRLPAILADSRKYQNVVSTQLAEQVMAALFELLRGFQAADDQSKGDLLRKVLADDPNHVYNGLLTVLMRLVFVLYAEDRNLLSSDSIYTNHHSVTGLFDRLRADDGRFPDTMDQRYGAWAQLLVLFRIIHDGTNHDRLRLPARRGYLFDPDRYKFLEGRGAGSSEIGGRGGVPPIPHPPSPTSQLPRVPDGVIHRVLRNLLILDGERLSYRTLDVEQIGSVYEAIMGFRLEIAAGRSIAIKPVKRHGAPAAVNLEALLAENPANRAKWLKEQTDQKFEGKSAEGLKDATTIDELLAALDKKIAKTVTPNVVPTGAMVLQPSDERRRSGSHYTPRSLTEPIVRKTLEPILQRLASPSPSQGEGKGEGARVPTPEQILELKVCDPAMGSGAFLVEACRQLGDELVRSWHAHGRVPTIPPDEDELLHARRIVAQRCLYGVDKNPMAVDLAKLSLWLATLAKDHPFTFLDHALRAGDSLVGLTREQIGNFTWELGGGHSGVGKKKKKAKAHRQMEIGAQFVQDRIARATAARRAILDAGDAGSPEVKRQQLAVADEALDLVRFAGDLCVAAFFAADTDKKRQAKREEYFDRLTAYLTAGDPTRRPTAEVAALRNPSPHSPHPISPFHWEIEFPEIFQRDNRGFDAFVGNPPFLGGTSISTANSQSFLAWLMTVNPASGDRMDLVAYFFRRAYGLLAHAGAFGLIATNTIAQGDTRKGGLRWIVAAGGQLFNVKRRLKWPGEAAVIVAVVHCFKGDYSGDRHLDNHQVEKITAFLFHVGGSDDPLRLQQNRGLAFNGVSIYGMGFTFADSKADATSTRIMQDILAARPASASIIQPYIGGDEVNDHPTHEHSRFVINFSGLSETEARSRHPELMEIVEQKVKPERLQKASDVAAYPWWLFWRERGDLRDAICDKNRMLVCARHQPNWGVVFLPTTVVASDALIAFALSALPGFCVLQSRPHEIWARFFGSSMKDDLRYTPSDCFETYPFPEDFEADLRLEDTGETYYEFRAALMLRNNEGLTKTYNRFHDPSETSPDIVRLRELHADMDRAVLDAYRWTDIPTDCGFALDYLDLEDEDDLPPDARDRIEAGDLFFPDAASAVRFNAAVATGRRRLPWRYRWPDEVRDEVLARLLALNAQRAEQERLSGAAAEAGKPAKQTKRGRSRKQAEPSASESLFGGSD
jgi:hypothetical protein